MTVCTVNVVAVCAVSTLNVSAVTVVGTVAVIAVTLGSVLKIGLVIESAHIRRACWA